MERVLLVRCPALLVEDEGGDVLRRFARVVEAVGSLSPWVTAVRPGICTVPARGPARFFGGEEAVVRLVRAAVAACPPGTTGTGMDGRTGMEVGVADGVFAAHLAARRGRVVPPGGTPAFLAGWPLDVLEQPELAQLLARLGLRTLGAFAALPERHVLARLGAVGITAHRLARGVTGELPGFRQPALAARVARLVAPAADAGGAGLHQAGFWGGRRHADERAASALGAVQQLLGAGAVQVARPQGGRSPAERARFSTWAGLAPITAPAAPPTGASGPGPGGPAADTGPWPGRLPPPAPAVVLRQPAPVTLAAGDGGPLSVTGRGALTAEPRRLRIGGGPWVAVTAWAGPWPSWERWWTAAERREARLQVVTGTGLAHLLAARHDGWWLLATYD